MSDPGSLLCSLIFFSSGVAIVDWCGDVSFSETWCLVLVMEFCSPFNGSEGGCVDTPPGFPGGCVVVGCLGSKRRGILCCGKSRHLWRSFSLLQMLSSICLVPSLSEFVLLWVVLRLVLECFISACLLVRLSAHRRSSEVLSLGPRRRSVTPVGQSGTSGEESWWAVDHPSALVSLVHLSRFITLFFCRFWNYRSWFCCHHNLF